LSTIERPASRADHARMLLALLNAPKVVEASVDDLVQA
jgi:hypothetical protein